MGRTVEKKRKKKGRPSLLDLQKRSLRLQQQQEQNNGNPNPSPNPSLRFPNSAAGLRVGRRHPDQEAAGDDNDDDDDAEEDEDSRGRRREKKLKLVLRLPNRSSNSPRRASCSASSGSGSDAGGDAAIRKRKIDTVGRDLEKVEEHNSGLKATDSPDSGPMTHLPDKKLLVFILDRLQKKDTYSVFSEPVDPEELPDYHEIIEHPMDFGTVRKKLLGSTYANLEQFENDVFLICSNAMRYNAPSTIYHRQARSIHELAKKNFENLRQESDDNEPEAKTVRRGRPPSKNAIKQTVGRPPADRTCSDLSDATLANASHNGHWSNLTQDMLRKGSVPARPTIEDVSARASHGLRNNVTSYSWTGEHKSDRSEEYSGTVPKGIPMKYWKKNPIMDENRRNTYMQPQLSTCVWEPSVLTTFDWEKKLLVPVGLHMERAYARSLARFAARLGPIGWEIAAKRIERALPWGTKFGPGWVGDGEASPQSQTPILSASPPHPSSQPTAVLPSNTMQRGDQHLERQEPPANNSIVKESRLSSNFPPSNRSSDFLESAQSGMGLNHDRGLNLLSGGGGCIGVRSETPIKAHQDPAMQPTKNGFNTAHSYNLLSQVEKMVRPIRPPGSFGSEASSMMTSAPEHGMVSRSSSSAIDHAPTNRPDAENVKLVRNPRTEDSSGSPLPDSAGDSQGRWRGSSLNPKPGPVPPDLNVGFQLPGSPVSGVQPDLALQL